MGLIVGSANAIKSAVSGITGGFTGALDGVLGQAIHQEYFTSGEMSNDVLMKSAEQVRPNGSANRGSDSNVISSGSVIDVQPNQCMIIVEDGKIIEACMEPGRFIYETSIAPSFLAGGGTFGSRFKAVAKEVWEQSKMGGQRRHTQRIYFLNMGILDKSLKWGLGNVSFKHTQRFEGLPAPLVCTVHVKGFGTARIRLVRPLEFYELYGAKYAGGSSIVRVTLDGLERFFENTKHKMSQAVSIAMAELGRNSEMAYDEIMVGENMQHLAELVNEHLRDTDLYKIGLDCYDFTVGGGGLTITDEDAAMISTRQQQMMMLANGAANYDIQTQMAQGFAKGAEKGGIQNMMGMGMIMGGMGGLGGLGNVGSTQPMYNPQYGRQPQSAPMQPQMGVVASGMPQQTNAPQQASVAAQDDSWVCSCRTTVSGNFCPQCGKKKEAKMEMPSNTWTCPTCHTENTMLFCGNCGTKRPERKQIVVCDKCHWTSENTSIRFCPQCGDPVTDADLQ